jgi:Phosphotransferase enzyme family
MSHGQVAADLAAGLGGPAATALAEFAGSCQRNYELDRWLVNGRSRAPVAVVLESDHRTGSARRLVLKVTTAEQTEVLRQHQARAQAPAEFAGAHLAGYAHEPQRVGDGSWLSFQDVAGDDIESVEVLTVLFNAMLDGSARETRCDPATFAGVCGAVIGGILNGWTGRPWLAPERYTVARFLRRHVLDQLAPGGRLHALSARYDHDTIEVPGEPGPLPNPFALARGTYQGSTPMIPALTGRTHGDVHSDNIMVRVRPAIDGTDFHLVDLALYEPDGPVTRDPAHFVLYLLARRMDTLSPAQQSALITVLLDPQRADGKLLPGWLADLIYAVDDACLAWLKGSGLQREYRRQRLLSIAGSALLFLGRTSTRPEDHGWFLRLSARAAAAFLSATLDATARIPHEGGS